VFPPNMALAEIVSQGGTEFPRVTLPIIS
jgi:hypothetical protein